ESGRRWPREHRDERSGNSRERRPSRGRSCLVKGSCSIETHGSAARWVLPREPSSPDSTLTVSFGPPWAVLSSLGRSGYEAVRRHGKIVTCEQGRDSTRLRRERAFCYESTRQVSGM